MIKRFITLLLAFSSFCAVAQKEDYTWLAGYSSWGGYDSNFHYWFGITKFDFNNQPVSITYDSLGINFQGANFTMCSEEGTPLFYTNGVSVRNAHDELIVDSMHNGYYLNNVWQWHDKGIPNDGAMVVLPHPNVSTIYDILYSFADTNSLGIVEYKSVKRTKLNFALQEDPLVYKDKPASTMNSRAALAAVKHGNGKDWWLLRKQNNSNCYQVLLYDGTDSLKPEPITCPSGAFVSGYGQTVIHRFSPDGSKFITLNNVLGGFNLFSFDRCTGEIELSDSYTFPERADSSGYYFYGAEFSPNSKYLYVCGSKRLYQFDSNTGDVGASRKVISYYHKFSSSLPLTYGQAQLAPDGKIYVSSKNTIYYMAVINNPDEEGTACNFQDTIQTPSFIQGLPYYPNYRLGALPGSPCDTITGIKDIAEKEKMLKIFPNPAADVATIDYGYTDWSKGEATMEITNNLGQVVHSQTLPMYSGFQKLEVGKYPSGAYTVYIKRKGVVVTTGKLVKE